MAESSDDRPQMSSDIKTKARISSDMGANTFTVDKNLGLIVYRFKVKQDHLPFPVCRDLKCSCEPHPRDVQFLQSGQAALDTRRDEDLALQRASREKFDALLLFCRL
ncbi:hypothetical protein BN1723_011775, partial [Verticillium longisporum]